MMPCLIEIIKSIEYSKSTHGRKNTLTCAVLVDRPESIYAAQQCIVFLDGHKRSEYKSILVVDKTMNHFLLSTKKEFCKL